MMNAEVGDQELRPEAKTRLWEEDKAKSLLSFPHIRVMQKLVFSERIINFSNLSIDIYKFLSYIFPPVGECVLARENSNEKLATKKYCHSAIDSGLAHVCLRQRKCAIGQRPSSGFICRQGESRR